MVLVQRWPFFQIFFEAIQVRKMSFTIFQNEKTPFQALKTTSKKTRKIDIFSKGSTHGFGPKMAIFPTYFFQAVWARKMFFTIFWKGKSPFSAIETRTSKTRNIDIFQKRLTQGFVQIWPFFKLSFLGNKGKENVFYDFLERRIAFLGYRYKNFKKSKH